MCVRVCVRGHYTHARTHNDHKKETVTLQVLHDYVNNQTLNANVCSIRLQGYYINEIISLMNTKHFQYFNCIYTETIIISSLLYV